MLSRLSRTWKRLRESFVVAFSFSRHRFDLRRTLQHAKPLFMLGVSRGGFATYFSLGLIAAKAMVNRLFINPIAFLFRCWKLEVWTAEYMNLLRLIKSGGGTKSTVANIVLRSALDEENIALVSKFAHRFCYYQRQEGSDTFSTGITPVKLIALMKDGVLSFCISYKHERTCYAEIHRDRSRIYDAVTRLAHNLSADRMLFWSDVTGTTIGHWGEQGIEPYLLLPTVRLVTWPRRNAIQSSFWMSVEKVSAFSRGGLITVEEGTGCILLNHDNSFMSSYVDKVDDVRLALATTICSPALYFKKSMFEADKIEVMKYALVSANPAYSGRQDENGFLSVVGRNETRVFFKEMTSTWTRLTTTRPQEIYSNKNGACWRGHEELLPVIKALDCRSRALVNAAGKEMCEVIKMDSDSSEVAIVLIRLAGGAISSTALKLEVSHYEERVDRFLGHVVSYQVASLEEEELFKSLKPVQKSIRFGESEGCCHET